MSNKLTRKSLAFGAMVALASSVIAGAPAQAAGEIIVAPTAGTTYTTFSTETFNLATSFAPGVTPASYGQLKYEVASSAAIRTGAGTGVDTAAAITAATLADTTLTSGKAVVTPGTAGTATDVRVLKVAIGTVAAPGAATTATQTVTVTAFVDANNDGALTAGEWNAAQTITFKKYEEVTPTVALTPVLAGDLALKATATYPSDLNTAMLTAADFKVTFTGATDVAAAPGVVAASGVYEDAVTGVVAAATVTAQAYYKTVALGTAVSGTVGAQTVVTNVAALVEGADAKLIGTTPTVRLNSAFSVKATLRGAVVAPATVGPVVANKAVTVAITGAGTLTTTRTLSINGTVYNGVTAIPASIALTSDANGEVKVDLKSVGFAATDAAVSLTFTSENVASNAVAVSQAATAYAITADNGNLYSTKLGTPASVVLSVKDQFGTLSAVADRIAVTPTASTPAPTGYVAPGTSYVMLSGGKATISVSSLAATAAGQITVATALQTLNAATQNYDAYATPVAGTAILVNVTTAADSFTTAPAATATAKVNADAYTDAISTTAGYSATYTVVVANPGTAITVAAPGAYINAGGTFGEGTATVNSPSTGSVDVKVYFHTVGSTTVTFTNGVAVKTSVVTVTTDLAPAKVAIVAPAQAQVGQAMDVVINVTDKWDNAVATPTTGTNAGILSVSSTGAGYFASAAPVANAAGKATVKYIVGTADIGTAFMSATLDLATDVTVARSVEFGLTDGDVLAGGKRIFVSAEFAKGRTVTVTVNGKRIYSKVQATDNAQELAFTQRKAGLYTVTVRISGGIVFTEKVRVN